MHGLFHLQDYLIWDILHLARKISGTVWKLIVKRRARGRSPWQLKTVSQPDYAGSVKFLTSPKPKWPPAPCSPSLAPMRRWKKPTFGLVADLAFNRFLPEALNIEGNAAGPAPGAVYAGCKGVTWRCSLAQAQTMAPQASSRFPTIHAFTNLTAGTFSLHVVQNHASSFYAVFGK